VPLQGHFLSGYPLGIEEGEVYAVAQVFDLPFVADAFFDGGFYVLGVMVD